MTTTTRHDNIIALGLQLETTPLTEAEAEKKALRQLEVKITTSLVWGRGEITPTSPNASPAAHSPSTGIARLRDARVP
jgi:hypothetical protein